MVATCGVFQRLFCAWYASCWIRCAIEKLRAGYAVLSWAPCICKKNKFEVILRAELLWLKSTNKCEVRLREMIEKKDLKTEKCEDNKSVRINDP